MRYIVKDLDDSELGRANAARSARGLIEAEWPDAMAVSSNGTRARGRMMLVTLLENAGEVLVVRYHRQVWAHDEEVPRWPGAKNPMIEAKWENTGYV